jgi:threonine aldolase
VEVSSDISKPWRGFASDNYAGAHPQILDAIIRANEGHQTAYGDDETTARLEQEIKRLFGEKAQIFPVFNGTGANVTAIQSMTRSWEAVICATTAHINADEGGAPEKVAGLKLWTVTTPDGKLTPELIDVHAFDFGFVHRAQPAVVAITQSTEYGTVYTVEEIRAITDHAHKLGLKVHLDGARIANAAVSLGKSFREFTVDAGVDAISFGGTKNGALSAEAVITFDEELAKAMPFVRKSAMQLSSKMRYISAQLLALLENDLWKLNATNSNEMAKRLADGIKDVVKVTKPVDANAVFAILPEKALAKLQEEFHFYVWDHTIGECRLMCSWDTTEQDVDTFIAAIRQSV